jgi:peptidoglycan/LPS O-acetylase OafA/YrhL
LHVEDETIGVMVAKNNDRRLEALESLRGVAAFYVFMHHIAHFSLEQAYPRFARAFVFGQAAVMIFFVLSGFVIFHSTRRPGFRDYFARRLRRIYPLFLIAMLLAYVGQCIAQRAVLVPSARSLLVNVLMLQDGGEKPGVWAAPFMGNSPLWSLSYEWFFYMAFYAMFVLLKDRQALQKYVVAGMSLLGFVSYALLPNPISTFLTYFVLWWAGVELAREYRATGTVSWKGQAFSLLAILVVSLLWLVNAKIVGVTSPWAHPMLELRHFVSTLGILVVGLAWYRRGAKGFSLLFGWGKYVAPISYAIYICHVPVITVANALRLTSSPLLDVLWVIPAVLGIAYLLEQKIQPWINSASTRWLAPMMSRQVSVRP